MTHRVGNDHQPASEYRSQNGSDRASINGSHFAPADHTPSHLPKASDPAARLLPVCSAVALRRYGQGPAVSGSRRVHVQLPAALRPSRSIPITSWRSQSRWKARPSTLIVLIAGLWLFGTGEALLVVAELGNGPWTVLAEGVSSRTSLSIGFATFAISLVVLALWIPLRERPGLGTIANAIVIAAALQVGVWLIPHPDPTWLKLLFVFAGVGLIGLGSGLYLTTNLGPGPRDGWMTGIHNKFDIPVSRVRLGIEVAVLLLGWLLGGTVGLGTVIFALLIGASVGWGLRLMDRGVVVRSDSEPELEA